MKASINTDIQFIEAAALNLLAAANENMTVDEFGKLARDHVAQGKAFVDLIPMMAAKIDFHMPIGGYRMGLATNALFDIIVQACFPDPSGGPASFEASDKFIDTLFQIMHTMRRRRKEGNAILLRNEGLTDIHGRPIAPTGPVRGPQ